MFNYDYYLGQQIKGHLKNHCEKITQWNVANLMGTKQTTVSQMLRGRAPISHGLVTSVAILLGVKPIQIDPFYEHPQRWGNNRIDFVLSPYLYFMFNESIGWCKIGITNAPKTRQKALTSSTTTPGTWEIIKCWELGISSKEMEQAILLALRNLGYRVDGELIEISPDDLIISSRDIIGDIPEVIIN